VRAFSRMNFKQIIQDYFTFSRNERKGVTILLIIIFLLAVANRVIFYFETPAKIDTALFDNVQNEPSLFMDSVHYSGKTNKLFRFNPNIIDLDALDSLNIPEKVKRNMLKFREKGGKYYSETDFRKIYGVTDSIFNQVEPFLMFGNKTVKFISKNPTPVKIGSELFLFDPNTATDKDFMRLGLSEKQIKTIRNYQSKGGSFRRKEDFFKIYGISESQKNALADYIAIEKNETVVPEKKAETAIIQIEINAADSVKLMQLPGIGDKLSKRIVKYRDLLGGFYDIAQLKEVYGLNEKVIKQMDGMIKVDPGSIHKIDLNFAEWNELARHPYIQKNLARQIVKFRIKYGSIHEASVLRDSMILSIDEYTRLKPYL
jgi:DNA uptake protein ComE-like DNA-binding protein